MIRADQIPDEVVEAFVDAFHGKDMTRKASIAAALNAWPRMRLADPVLIYDQPARIILPLPQEVSDE